MAVPIPSYAMEHVERFYEANKKDYLDRGVMFRGRQTDDQMILCSMLICVIAFFHKHDKPLDYKLMYKALGMGLTEMLMSGIEIEPVEIKEQ